VEDTLAEERMLRVEIHDTLSFDTIISPGDIRYYVLGHMLTEGFILKVDDLEEYREWEKDDVLYVTLRIKNFEIKKSLMKRNYNIIWTECGSGAEIKRSGDRFKIFKNEFIITGEDLLRINSGIKGRTEQFNQTGAFHYAFLFDMDINLIELAYDIGRHNAVDKVVGKLLVQGIDLNDKILFVTGRITSDICLKCLRARIPVVVSRSAVLDSSVRIARKYNMGLVGFLRGKRLNIYSNGNIKI
jgi:FdhD protein